MYISISTTQEYHTRAQEHKHHLYKPIIILHSHNHSLQHTASHKYLVCSFNVRLVLQQYLHNTNMTLQRRYIQGSATILHHHHESGGRRLVCGKVGGKKKETGCIGFMWSVAFCVHILTLTENCGHAHFSFLLNQTTIQAS